MILSQVTNRHGNTYRYFFCTGRYSHTCELPYIPLGKVEETVEEHYATVRFTSEFTTAVRADLAAMLDEQQTATKLLHAQLTRQLRELDTKETNLVDLAADGTLPQDKIRTRLREIARQRERINVRLQDTDQDLSMVGEIIEACLQLLEDPQVLYQRCDDQQRRRLNQALFEALYIYEESSGSVRVDHQLKEPFDTLHAAQSRQTPVGLPEAPGVAQAAMLPPQTAKRPSPARDGRCRTSNRGRPGGRPLKVAGFQLSYSGGDERT